MDWKECTSSEVIKVSYGLVSLLYVVGMRRSYFVEDVYPDSLHVRKNSYCLFVYARLSTRLHKYQVSKNAA